MSQTCRYQSSNANSHTLLRHVKIVRPSKSTKKIVDGKLNPHISSRSDVSDNSNIEEKLLNQVFEVKRETLDWFAREYRLRNVMKAVERQSSNHSVSNNINSNYQGIKDLNKEISRHINKYRGFCSKDITRIPSRILYCETWFSTFDKSDFEQMIPNFNGMLGDWSLKHEEMSFNLIRNRAAKDLSALKGYFLIFETIEMANIFLYETTGSEISGMQATFHFIDAELSDLEPEVIGRPVRFTLKRLKCLNQG
ncbi:hypothetical protein NADFUDRAFT_69846 [Nadsonia fulvescens var. elongata DSM 6958]|uniref:Uncharacterized protein n=1 Tax=Nadsonia fulvescens var. elongata DSM 6958 TaxID=857566 RepID=A0A1E3PMP6_9ASCO|nr:hypothetical protein NADFUDRAFT_69846 [Nadsonia fulvescens var. elongata DSM 6958]